MKNFAFFVCILVMSGGPSLLWSQQEKVDLETITRIRYEGFHNSKVMDFATGLMDNIGERLTGSPNMKQMNGRATSSRRWVSPTRISKPGDRSAAAGRINMSTFA